MLGSDWYHQVPLATLAKKCYFCRKGGNDYKGVLLCSEHDTEPNRAVIDVQTYNVYPDKTKGAGNNGTDNTHEEAGSGGH